MRCFVLVLAAARASSSRKAVIGFDIGTESVRAGLFDASTGELLATKSHPHETRFPAAGHAEQIPSEWWTGLGETCRAVVAECDAEVVALCLAATSCTVVACKSDGTPLRDCLLWMDQRSAAESDEILRLGDGDDALNVNAQGKGPISAEWMLPKALWLKKHEPETYDSTDIICECQDWLNYRCTGTWVAGGCNVATRWHCDGKAACEAQVNNRFGGRPSELLRRTGLEALETKWPQACVAMGQRAGTLTAAAAAHLGLREGTPVAQGGADAFVLRTFAASAVATTVIGLLLAASQLLSDVVCGWVGWCSEEHRRLVRALATALPALGALGGDDAFYELLAFAGAVPVPLLYCVLPPFLLASLRARRVGRTTLLPGGALVLNALKLIGVAFVGTNILVR